MILAMMALTLTTAQVDLLTTMMTVLASVVVCMIPLMWKTHTNAKRAAVVSEEANFARKEELNQLERLMVAGFSQMSLKLGALEERLRGRK